MKQLLKLINAYEKRNNVSATLMLESDGTGQLSEYNSGEALFEFEDTDELMEKLKA